MDIEDPQTIISSKSPSDMSEAEKCEERKLLRERLKSLNATPHSDWHREFERILRDDAKAYGKDVEIIAERLKDVKNADSDVRENGQIRFHMPGDLVHPITTI